MINRTLARRLRRVEGRLRPEQSLPQVVIRVVDSQRRVVKSLVYEPGKGYVSYAPGRELADVAPKGDSVQMSPDVLR